MIRLPQCQDRFRYIAAIVAGLVLAAAFPKMSVAGFVWIAPGAMLAAAFGTGGGRAFRIGWVAGLAHFLTSLYWLLNIPVMKLAPVIGFQGSAAGAAQVRTTRKKQRGRPLHHQHRRANRKLARARVPVEHALASVKRPGILRQPLRAKRKTTADGVLLIGCAWHNLHLDQKALAA